LIFIDLIVSNFTDNKYVIFVILLIYLYTIKVVSINKNLKQMKNKDLQEIYFRFLNLVRSVEELPNFPKLDATENQLLNEVASKWKKGERLLVSDAIAKREIGSPATLHARLKQLRDKDMVTYVIETDGRKKYIEPTENALKYFSHISNCMIEATAK
jgi:hypothetical protein